MYWNKKGWQKSACVVLININMRCIEINIQTFLGLCLQAININMRCIEISLNLLKQTVNKD